MNKKESLEAIDGCCTHCVNLGFDAAIVEAQKVLEHARLYFTGLEVSSKVCSLQQLAKHRENYLQALTKFEGESK